MHDPRSISSLTQLGFAAALLLALGATACGGLNSQGLGGSRRRRDGRSASAHGNRRPRNRRPRNRRRRRDRNPRPVSRLRRHLRGRHRLLQRPLRAGDRHVGRHPVHEPLHRQRRGLHEGARLLLARLQRRRLRRHAVQGRERELHRATPTAARTSARPASARSIRPTATAGRPGRPATPGPGGGCCTDNCDETQDPPRCGFGKETCFAEGAACTGDAQCCRGVCDPTTHACKTPCTANGAACTGNAGCCSNSCAAGSCAPPASSCQPVSGACTTGTDCCSTFCVGGFCEPPISIG